MPTRMSMAEKELMAKILKQDLDLVEGEVFKQFSAMWEATRGEVEIELGLVDRKREIEDANAEIAKLQQKISEIQQTMREYSEHPTVKDYVDAGLEPPKNHRNGFIYNHNIEFMGMSINSKMDCHIVKAIKAKCDPEKPLQMLCEIAQSAYRALIMSGTYEEARASYDKFYSLDFHRYGVKIPRKLEEIKKIEGKNLMSAQAVIVPLIGHKEPANAEAAQNT